MIFHIIKLSEFFIMKASKLIKSAALLFRGFTFATADEWLYLDGIKKYKRRNNIGMSDKEIFSLMPFDSKFDKLFGDLLSMAYALDRHAELLPEQYYSLLTRDGEQLILPLRPGLGQSMDGVVSLIREKGSVLVRPASNSVKTAEQVCRFDGESFFLGESRLDEDELRARLRKLPAGTIVTELVVSDFVPTLHLAFFNGGDGPELLFSVLTAEQEGVPGNWYTLNRELSAVGEDGGYDGGRIAGFPDIERTLRGIAAEFGELEYMNFALRLTDGGFKILRVDTGADLTYLEHFNDKTAAFIRKKCAEKPRFVSFRRALTIIDRYFWSFRAKRHGFMDYMYRGWKRALREDSRDKYTTAEEKKWAHERGFLSYHIKQYGLTEENWRGCLSDRDYKWLRPLNNDYRKLLWDKVTLRYCLDKYRQYLPEYYYHIVPRGGKMTLLKMPDCPERFPRSFAGLLMLLREKGLLAMKPTVGSHGTGFYRLAFDGTAYSVNGEAKTEGEMLAFLSALDDYYNISEYIVMHGQLRGIYSEVACTVRIMVINRHGLDPVIENAYFRIGTRSTGFTDNIGSGGVFAYVDEKTGFFHDAEIIREHIITPCPLHPDTQVKIEGFLPHWDEVLSVIPEICRYISPLEYLGFDVVLTDAGFKILEINTHQDLHRYPTYNENVHAYFMHKLELKRAGKRLC